MQEIDISVFEKEIAAEYMRLFSDQINSVSEESKRFTTQIMNVAAATAAIAIKKYDEMKNS